MRMRWMAAALLIAFPAFADTSGPRRMFRETRWASGDFAVGANDPLQSMHDRGDVAGIQLTGLGESVMLRRRRFSMARPVKVVFRVRWTEGEGDIGYPSVNLVFNPPALDDGWWKEPIEWPPGSGRWAGGRQGFVFHFANDPNWRRVGVSASVENADGRHAYSAEKGKWVEVALVLDAAGITVRADGKEVARAAADLGGVSTFACGFGDQHRTRVELDELSVTPGR